MGAENKICLNMIVKNESAIIERCLRSVLAVIDHYVICDTGSTDDTVKLIKDICARAGVSGEIHRAPFIDFGTSRNQALDQCRSSPLPRGHRASR